MAVTQTMEFWAKIQILHKKTPEIGEKILISFSPFWRLNYNFLKLVNRAVPIMMMFLICY